MMTTPLPERPLRLAFICSDRGDAVAARQRLADRYGEVPAHEADVLVALGGDGLMLEALHERKGPAGKPLCPIYGVNLGTVGFLMNPLTEDNLIDRIRAAEPAVVHPLRMRAETMDGRTVHAYAFNEVSLLRQTRQTAKLRIRVDGAERMAELACDGALVSTPVGSTAYNLSAHGPIIPLNAQVMALTPISAFRPRYWRGALLSHKAEVRFETLEPEKRPVSAVADNVEVRSVTTVTVAEARDMQAIMLFDAGSGFEERVLAEQFST